MALDLSPEGFDLAAAVIKELGLVDIKGQQLSDFSDRFGLVMEASFQDMTVDLSLADVRLTPSDAAIDAEFSFNKARLKIGKLILYPSIPVLRTECLNAEYVIADGEPVRAALRAGIRLVDGQVRLTREHFSLAKQVRASNVIGPSNCTGVLKLGWVRRVAARGFLKLARLSFGGAINRQIVKLMPEVEAAVNRLTHQEFPVEIRNFPAQEKRQLLLGVQPTRLTIGPSGLNLVCAVRSRIQKTWDQGSEALSVPPPVGGLLDPQHYASAGINKLLINEIIANYLPLDDEFHEVTPGEGEGDELLSRRSLAALWPDLNLIHLDQDHLRLKVRVNRHPRVEPDSRSQDFAVYWESLTLLFQIKSGGAWRDYFIIDLSLRANAVPQLREQWFEIKLGERYEANFRGQWANGYEPEDPTFEQDVFQLTMDSFMDYLRAAGPVYRALVPILNFKPYQATVKNLRVESGWVRVDIANPQ